jgi:tRNA-Thr(GGU) m(6)t(6)A37 methyltransferase TsaA
MADEYRRGAKAFSALRHLAQLIALRNVMTVSEGRFELRVIGYVESPLAALEAAPRQPDEGAPAATLVLEPDAAAGLQGLAAGDAIIVITWLHLSDRNTLRVHPRDDRTRPSTGVFNTRSPDRPNPIGLHRAVVTSVAGHRVAVSALEAIDGTPIIDIKPVLNEDIASR